MKVHIFVATTQGLVAIQNITAIDDVDISSIVSINGTSTTANISSAYHNFVKKGAGIIQQDFGACSYRINIDKRIDQGNSWQLAFYLAHAAKNENTLGDGQVKPGDNVICATGEINTSSKKVQRISQISLKQKLAAPQIKQWHKQKINVSSLVPYDNAQDIDKKLPLNIKLVKNLAQALTHLPSKALTPVTPNPLNNKAINTTIKFSYWFNQKTNLLLILVTSFIFLLLVLSLNTGLFTNSTSLDNVSNKLPVNTLQKTFTKNNIPSEWQIVLLNKPKDEIDQSLQTAYAVIEKTLAEQLISNNFDITDTSLITGAKNLTEQTLFQLNNVNSSNNHKVNLAISFNLSINKINNATKSIANNTETWRYELSSYLINLKTKRKIETHTEYGEYSKEIINCDQQCFSQWFADNTKKLAQDMGAILVVKLNNLPRHHQLTLTFNNFLSKELSSIRDHLESMNGFVSNRLELEFNTKKTLLHQTSSQKYLYTSYLPNDEVSLALSNIFIQLGITITKTQNGTITNSHVNSLVVNRNSMPYFLHYIFSVVISASLLVLLFFTQRRRFSRAIVRNENSHISDTSSEINKYSNLSTNTKRSSKKVDTQTVKGTVIGKGALSNYYIFTASTLALGRLAVDPKNSFAIGYQNISRVGKQCTFSYINKTFYIEEQGSTNGSYLNNVPLPTLQKTEIVSGSNLILGGTSNGNIAPCQLTLNIAEKQSTALIMQLNSNVHSFINQNNIQQSWPSIAKDLTLRWVMLVDEVSLSIDNDKVVLGCSTNKAIAYLVYQNGFHIRPTKEVNNKVMVNQNAINEIMPIMENDIININGYKFSLQAL